MGTDEIDFKKLLTKANFRKWLKKKSSKTKVAPKNYGQNDCPIANFIKQKANCKHVCVNDKCTAVLVFLGFQNYYHPQWVLMFIEKLDSVSQFKSVSAQKALKILESL